MSETRTETTTETRTLDVERNGDYQIALDCFEGPLDLLLYLVRKHELDIFDIPIAFITARYLEYLDLMRALNLDVAADYLLMAATLAYIKSRLLVPQPAAIDEDGDEDEAGDPRQELIRRLLEYQKYKQAGAELAASPTLGREVFLHGTPAEIGAGGDEPEGEVGLFRLVEALERVMARASVKLTHDVLVDRVSIAERIQLLVDRLATEERFTFDSCFEEAAPDLAALRHVLVVTFLAILEMARLRMIHIHQPTAGGDIYVSRPVRIVGPPLRSASECGDGSNREGEPVVPTGAAAGMTRVEAAGTSVREDTLEEAR